MDSSSSSNSRQAWRYHVFLSFRGDTRNNFTDHLYAALQRKGIYTFKDDKELRKGETLEPKLIKAINESRVSIVVFSKQYADSKWCLEELANIVECMELEQQTVLPVFYDVDPSDVRNQSGDYKEAFDEYERKFREDLQKVKRWRDALKKMGNKAGWDVRGKAQAEVVEKIANDVIRKLGPILFSLDDDLIGMDTRAEEFEKILALDSQDDVRVIGICGMGGIGKTTLATVAYNRYSQDFEARSVLLDISKFSNEIISIQKQLLSDTLGGNLKIRNPHQGTNFIRSSLRCLKAFIVLDNIDDSKQLEKLPRKSDLGAGSRIIITTRDQRILTEHEVDEVYNVELLNEEESLQLFCRKAFKGDDIKTGYEELTHRALEYAQSLPLAIRVLGSLLFNRNESKWTSILDRLQEHPNRTIMDVLRTSYDGLLEETNKEMFLDIACFFNGMHHYYVTKIQNYFGRYPGIGITELIEKSLITILHQKVRMHDLLQEVGRNIVQEEKPSRLWHYKDFQERREMEDIEAMVLTPQFPDKYQLDFPSEDLKDEENFQSQLRAEPLSQMSHLRLLVLYNVNFSGSLSRLSNELIYLFWHKYPFTSLPSSFQPDRLIELNMPGSSIEQLWEGKKSLPNLKRINLCHSKNLIKITNFSELQNLERLELGGCSKLQQIDPSLALLKKLWFLDLAYCKSLVSLPNSIWGLSYLKVLYLTGCANLVLNNQLLEKVMHSELLKTPDVCAVDMPSTSFSIPTIPIAPSMPDFPSLQYLNLSFCGLCEIPDSIGQLICLERLNLGVNNFVRLPSTLKNLSKLAYLNLEHCKELQSLPELPSITALPVRRDSPPEERDEGGSLGQVSGLYIFNCPKLAGIEGHINMALSWILRVLQEPHAQGNWIDICIPGSQIPGWFHHPTLGSAISLQQSPPPNVDDKNWIGVAFCATFAVHNHTTNLNDEGTIETLGKGRRPCFSARDKEGGRVNIPIPIFIERGTVESDHLWLIYITREHGLMAKIIRSVEIGVTACLGMEVKNCALRWVFQQDLEDLYTLIHDGR